MTNSSRHEIPERPACQRARDFIEVTTGYDFATAKAEAERCLHCKNAPCMQGCPVSVHIPDFIAAVISGDIDKAGAIIEDTNSLPSICGRVCPQENQCESKCVGRDRRVGTLCRRLHAQPRCETCCRKAYGQTGCRCRQRAVGIDLRVRTDKGRRRSGGVRIAASPGLSAYLRNSRISSVQKTGGQGNRFTKRPRSTL